MVRGWVFPSLLLLVIGGLVFSIRWTESVDKKELQKKMFGWSKQTLEIQEKVNQGELDSAQEETHQLIEDFTNSRLSSLSTREIQHLAQSLNRLEETFSMAPHLLPEISNQAVLVFDAISHQFQPLWTQYKEVLMEDLGELQRFYVAKDTLGIRFSGKMMEQHFRQIEPVIQLVYSKEKVNDFSQLIQEIHEKTSRPSSALSIHPQEIMLWKNSLRRYFSYSSPSFVPWTSALICLWGMIIFVLSLICWRMYKQSFVIRVVSHK